MKDHVGLVGDELVGLALGGEIAGRGGDFEFGGSGLGRCDNVIQRQFRDLRCAEAAVLRELLRELLADHAGAADDEDFHCNSPMKFAGHCAKAVAEGRADEGYAYAENRRLGQAQRRPNIHTQKRVGSSLTLDPTYVPNASASAVKDGEITVQARSAL